MGNHFTRPAQRSSVLWRNSTYRNNCTSGFITGIWEAHHIACNHAVEGRVITKNKKYVEDCLWITDWDLNDSKNLIGLPKNKQYRKTDGTIPVNMCSHQVDHNTSDGYTEECKKWLKDNVWDTLNDAQKKHDVNAKKIKAQLDKCTTTFKRKLQSRGVRKGGTVLCWKNRHKKSWANKWYYPFSMAKKPRKRHPGANTKKMTGIFAQIS